MSEALDAMFKNGTEKMEKALGQLHRDFTTVRTGRANPAMLDKVMVDYYGVPTPLKQMAQITVQEGTILAIAPFDKSIFPSISLTISFVKVSGTRNPLSIIFFTFIPSSLPELIASRKI